MERSEHEGAGELRGAAEHTCKESGAALRRARWVWMRVRGYRREGGRERGKRTGEESAGEEGEGERGERIGY